MTATGAGLTIGTAGHVDHGKTALVRALTGVQGDRLPEERARGLTIVLGYAPLDLGGGRVLSVVDVPGHERFVRTMVAGATGVDLALLVVAADDGVMPQTVEHVAVLRALGVRAGVVAVAKADVADPARAAAEASALVGDGWPVVPVSAVTGQGLDALRDALAAVADGLEPRAARGGPAVLHVDRAFTAEGRGTVVTGTLWSGSLGGGDRLELLGDAGAREVRVRGVEVHGTAVDRADAGRRVAVNVAGVRLDQAARGDVLCAPGARAWRSVLDCALELDGRARHGERVAVLHGTRAAPARAVALQDDGRLWQLRLDRPLAAADGERVVVRRLSPADTLGGGVVLDAAAVRHGRATDVVARLRDLADGRTPRSAPDPPASPAPPLPGPVRVRPAASEHLAAELRAAGLAFLSEAQLADSREALAALRAEGVAVRVAGRLYGHQAVVAEARDAVLALLDERGSISLAEVRDALATSRKGAQALLEHLDGERLTRRLPDDRRVRARSTGRPR